MGHCDQESSTSARMLTSVAYVRMVQYNSTVNLNWFHINVHVVSLVIITTAAEGYICASACTNTL